MILLRFVGTTGNQKYHVAAKIVRIPYFAILTIACIGGIDYLLAEAWKKASLRIIAFTPCGVEAVRRFQCSAAR
jgi:hypothetical protein